MLPSPLPAPAARSVMAVMAVVTVVTVGRNRPGIAGPCLLRLFVL